MLRGNIKKLQEEKDEVDMEVEKYKKETYKSKGEEKKKEEILELKQQIKDLREENDKMREMLVKTAEDNQLDEKICNEEKKKKTERNSITNEQPPGIQEKKRKAEHSRVLQQNKWQQLNKGKEREQLTHR